MNSQKEQVFVEKYINKRYKERLHFELSSKKKRRDGLDRFSHDTESAIDSKKLTLKTNKLNKHFFIKLFRNANNVYVLSDKYLDGKEMSITDAYEYAINEYCAVVICGDGCAVIKSENENTSEYFILEG